MSAETAMVPPNGEPSLKVTDPDLTIPQTKKMRQARLGFKPLAPKPLTSVQSIAKDSKKRKLSDPESPVAKQPKSVKPQTSVKPVHPENDNEVSSSSEADIHASSSGARAMNRKTLERFVCSVRKEEDITSTNDVIDLTSSPAPDASCSEENPNEEVCEITVSDSEEPMDVDNTGNADKNEPEVVLVESQPTCATVSTTDNVAKIIEQVASENFQLITEKPVQDLKRKAEEKQLDVSPSSSKTKKAVTENNPTNSILQSPSSAEKTEKCETKVISIPATKTIKSIFEKALASCASKCKLSSDKPDASVSNSKGVTERLSKSKSQINIVVDKSKNSVSPNTKNGEVKDAKEDTPTPETAVAAPCMDSPGKSESSSLTSGSQDVVPLAGSPNCDNSDSPKSSDEDESVPELSSSLISPQTADDSFKKVTSAGSTPRNTKPRTKVSSAKKAEREAQRQKRKEEKEREMQEKKRLKEEAKAEKERIRKEEKERKEKERQQKEKERQEKRDHLEKERLEKQQQRDEEKRKKQEINEAKLEEKRKRDEEKQALDEEKRRKEEEKLREDEEKLMVKKKMQDKFQSFFTKAKSAPAAKMVEEDQSRGRFMPFELKKDMRLAPQNFCQIGEENRDNLDKLLLSQDCEKLYLRELTSGAKPRKWMKVTDGATDPDIVELGHDSEVIKKMTYRVKLLQFHMNYRPPYYGTWRKRSKVISPRNPFKTDKELLDYEVDSDDEWEEEEPGESISASEGEEEKEGDDGDDDEDGWMVPDGYLSRDEGCDDEEEFTPEMLKARQMAWEVQLKRKCQPQTAIVTGCFWISEGGLHPGEDFRSLAQYKAVLFVDPGTNIGTSYTRVDRSRQEGLGEGVTDRQGDTPTSKGQPKRPVPEEAMPDLVQLVHGNPSGIKRLVEEFRMYWARKSSNTAAENTKTETTDQSKSESKEESMDVDIPPVSVDTASHDQSVTNTPVKVELDKEELMISKRQMEMRIAAIAVREKRSLCKKTCWYVHDSILQQYDLKDLPIPSKWQYVSIPNRKETGENLTPNSKTPNSKLQLPPPFSSPSEPKADTPKRPSDQRTITFFTKAKDAIMKTPETGSVESSDRNKDKSQALGKDTVALKMPEKDTTGNQKPPQVLTEKQLIVKPAQQVIVKQLSNMTNPTPRRITLLPAKPIGEENKNPASTNSAQVEVICLD